eukprot:1158048-Pelagomonas_calceolata.AAC.20
MHVGHHADQPQNLSIGSTSTPCVSYISHITLKLWSKNGQERERASGFPVSGCISAGIEMQSQKFVETGLVSCKSKPTPTPPSPTNKPRAP